jgi:predicted nucleic acid-binding protein
VIIDSSVVLRSIVPGSDVRKVMFQPWLQLYAPLSLRDELKGHEKELLKKSRLDVKEFDRLMEIMISRINFVSRDEYSDLIKHANKTGHSGDEDNSALAMRKRSCIWTYESSVFETGLGITTRAVERACID